MRRLVVGLTIAVVLVATAHAAPAPRCSKWCGKRYPVTAVGKALKQQQKANLKYCRFVCDQCKATGRRPCAVSNGRGKPPTTYCTCGDSKACCPDSRCKSDDGQCCPEGTQSLGSSGPCCKPDEDLCLGACCAPAQRVQLQRRMHAALPVG